MVATYVSSQGTLYAEWPRDDWNAQIECGLDYGSPIAPQLPLPFAQLSFVPRAFIARPSLHRT